MKTMLWLAGAFAMAVAGPAAAATLITPPFPATLTAAGIAFCEAANVGTNEIVVSMQMLDDNGGVLDAREIPIPPGASRFGGAIQLTSSNPTNCRFDFKGKVRASFGYFNGNNGLIIVIPATTK